MYLHLNYVFMLNWIASNGTVFDLETVLTPNGFIQYRPVLTVCKKNLYLYLTELAEVELFD